MTMTVLHARYQFVETIRVPIVVVGTMLFPVLAFAFFVVPQADIAGDPVTATAAAAQLSLFSTISVCLFNFGAGVAEDRATPWDPYLRTLPAGATPRIVGRLVNGLGFALLGLAPLVVLAAVATSATLTPLRLVLGVLALSAAATPFLGIGLAIGYRMPVKAAVPVAQVVLFPMAFAGGLFLPPETFPSWLDAFSRALPSRAGRDLVVAATTGGSVTVAAVATLVGWSALTLAVAGWAYRRDEGRRFR